MPHTPLRGLGLGGSSGVVLFGRLDKRVEHQRPLRGLRRRVQLFHARAHRGAQVLRRLDPVTGAQSIVQQDVVGAPMVGSSLTGSADTLVRSSSGDFLYRGATANPFASTPAGLELTPPVHGPLLAGTWLHLASNGGLVVLYLPDGTLLAGPVEFGVRQIAMTAAGGVVLVGSGIRYVNFGVNETLNRPNAAVRVVLSGAGG